MTPMIPAPLRAALAGLLAAGLLVGGAAAAPAKAKPVKACVKKSTGEVRILSGSKKKCSKGWKKVSWNKKGKTGEQGKTGATGSNLVVRDGNGNVLGRSLGVMSEGIAIFFVQIDGGAYTYLPSGTLYPLGNSSPDFLNNTCTGAAFERVDTSLLNQQLFTQSANGPSRVVYRRTKPSLGASFAWKFSTTLQDVNAQQLYQLDETGTCVLDGPAYTGKLGLLVQVSAPGDVPGPLTIG